MLNSEELCYKNNCVQFMMAAAQDISKRFTNYRDASSSVLLTEHNMWQALFTRCNYLNA